MKSETEQMVVTLQHCFNVLKRAMLETETETEFLAISEATNAVANATMKVYRVVELARK